MVKRGLFLGSVLGLTLGACGRDTIRDSFGCPEHQFVCDGACTDVSSDDAHCGACGAACESGEECLVGRCRPVCEAPLTLCSEGCVDTRANTDHCGRCGNGCAPGARCVQGACSATGCPPGLQRCGDACVDTTIDADHCGECFAECDPGMRCDNNVCRGGCGDRTECDGRCVDTDTNRNHCGECGNRCSSGQTCDGGECTGCREGLTRCAGECVDLMTSADNCGACNSPCGGTCIAGVCCPGNATVCGGSCVDTTTSVDHCGGCFSPCPMGQACAAGVCVEGCPPGLEACGDACVDVRSDPDHCGACEQQCDSGWVCRSGACITPADECDFGSLAFPIFLTGGVAVADITAGDDCMLYVGMQEAEGYTGVVYSIDGWSSDVMRVAEFSERVRGLVYREEDGLLYGTSLDRLVAVGVDGSEPRVLDGSVTGQFLNGMTIAPRNWPPGGGFFVVGRSTGDVVIYDPLALMPSTFVSIDSPVSDVEFDGQQLYLAAHYDNAILKVTPSGVVSTFAALPCNPDGLTVEPGSRLFASCDTGDLYAIDLDTAEVSWLGWRSLSTGWAPTGLLWQPGVLLVVEQGAGLNALFL